MFSTRSITKLKAWTRAMSLILKRNVIKYGFALVFQNYKCLGKKSVLDWSCKTKKLHKTIKIDIHYLTHRRKMSASNGIHSVHRIESEITLSTDVFNNMHASKLMLVLSVCCNVLILLLDIFNTLLGVY